MSHDERPEERLRKKIADASVLLRGAEDDLDEQVKLLEPVLSGDKHMATDALARSFERLISARRSLLALETLLEEMATVTS